MNISKSIKDNGSQILAITEKYIKLDLRFKISFAVSFILPIFSIIMPLIIMGRFFEFNAEFGPWTTSNYIVFPLTTYNLSLIIGIRTVFPRELSQEKFWHTFYALIIAPFNRLNLLLGIFISHIIRIGIPFIIFFVLCWFYYPITIFTILAVLLVYFLLALVFSGVGLVMGIFAISRENALVVGNFLFGMVFFFSCLSYPFQIYPEIIQSVIKLNPIYYFFEVLRFTWIEDNFLLTITTHPLHFLILITSALILPIIGIYLFKIIYNKYGIEGY